MRVNGYIKGFVRRFWQSSSDHRGTPQLPGRVVTLVSLKDIKENEQFHKDFLEFDTGDRRDINSLTEEDAKVWACAYYIPPIHVKEMKEYLDIREQDGYSVHKVPLVITEVPEILGEGPKVLENLPRDENRSHYLESIVYIGTIDNYSFVGPESVELTAEIIKSSEGPSGLNIEYLNGLARAIEEFNELDLSVDSYLKRLVELTSQG